MFAVFQRKPVAEAEPVGRAAAARDTQAIVANLARQASTLGREAAEVRGVLDDTQKVATVQAQAVLALARR